MAGYDGAQAHEAYLHMFERMLTAPASQPESEYHNRQISTLLKQSAIQQVLEAVIDEGATTISTISFQSLTQVLPVLTQHWEVLVQLVLLHKACCPNAVTSVTLQATWLQVSLLKHANT